MKKRHCLSVFILCSILFLSAESLIAQEFILRYESPAARWRESLPLGNGHLGVTVFGGINNERLQLSENSIYSGGTGTLTIDPLEAEYIKRQRELAINESVDAAMALTYEEFKSNWKGKIPKHVEIEGFKRCSKPVRRPVEQTLGNLDLFFSAHHDIVEDYERKLDLNTSTATTTFRVGNKFYKREVFCSYPDDVTVMKISCSEKGQITFSALPSRDTDVLASTKKRNLSGFMKEMVKRGVPAEVAPIIHKAHGKNIMTFSGQAYDEGTKFSGALKVITSGGKVYTKGNRIYVENADEAILFISCATNYYHGETYKQNVLNTINAASEKSYATLRENHLNDYQEIFNRIDISLGNSRASSLPTDVRLEAMHQKFEHLSASKPDNISIKEGSSDAGIRNQKEPGKTDLDPQLYALHFQYGRYLLISSSRIGYFPPGFVYWCPDLLSEWFGGHADDINQQMNYWMTDVCDMPEILEPLFNVLDSYVKGAKGVAKYQYDSRGMMISGFTPYGMTGPKDIWPGQPGKVGFPAGTGWFAQHYWEHYLFTLDKEFLKNRAYPFIKEATLFYLDYLAEDKKTGNLLSYPDYSPEGPYITKDGGMGKEAVGTTFTLSVCREVFSNFIMASDILGIDEKIRKECEKALPKIQPYRIGKYGQLQEWMEDYEDWSPGHRHVSHLYPVYPGYEITLDNNPELAEAVKQSLIRRRSFPDGYGYVGWSRAWYLNLLARLREPEMAHEEVELLLSKCTYPNMLGTHQMGKTTPDRKVNCIDGNFGYTAGIAEMLLQSHDSNIHLLPALPKANWPKGHITGLKARGGYKVNIYWDKGVLSKAVIKSAQDGMCTVRYDDNIVELSVKKGETYVLDGNLQYSKS